jgi:hypothetical protein
MQNNSKKSPKQEEASTQNNKRSPKQEEGPTQDCIICAYPIEGKERLRTLTTCEHTEPICSICFLRIRALQRNFHCPTCKREIDNVICTEIGETSHFNDYQIWNNNTIDETFVFDAKGQIFFPKEYYQNKIKKLWIFQCPLCQQTRRDLKQLRGHMINEHNMHMCNLCGEFKQVFPQEHKMYTQQHYDQHLRKGDKDGSNGHPLCEFCRKRFYDSTALFIHLTKDHFTCHLCEQQGIKFKYFNQYPELEAHFHQGHFLCDDPSCLEKRYIVFKNEIDLFSHRKNYHPHLVLNERQAIPLHFQYRKQDPNATVVNSTGERVFLSQPGEKEQESTKSEGHTNSEVTRKDRFEGGLGGRAFNGEWQVELQPTTSDPRDPNRNLHRDEVIAAQNNQKDEEFPELMTTGVNLATGQLINRWISIKDNSGAGNKSGNKSSYSSSATGAPKNKTAEFPSLPPKPAAAPSFPNKPKITGNKPSSAPSKKLAHSGSDIHKVMNYVNTLAEEEEQLPAPPRSHVVDSLGNWVNMKVDRRVPKKKSGGGKGQQRAMMNEDEDFDQEDYPTLGGKATSRANDDNWNSTGVVYSQETFSSDLEKALHDSLDEFNSHQLQKGTEVSIKEAVKGENYPSLSSNANQETTTANVQKNKGTHPKPASKPSGAKKSDDWSAAMKSIGLNAPKRMTKSAGISVIKPNNAKDANKKLTAGNKRDEINSMWKDNTTTSVVRDVESPKPPQAIASVAVAPPAAPAVEKNNFSSLSSNNKKYGGWVKLGGAYEENPNERPDHQSSQNFENDDFPTMGGKPKK